MGRPLQPEQEWACGYCGEVSYGDLPADRHCPNWPWLNMGWRVGSAPANYSWYSTRERALTDRRCK